MTREELIEQVESENLDSLVHDMKSVEATNINNEGSEAQVNYLLECGISLEDIEREAFPRLS